MNSAIELTKERFGTRIDQLSLRAQCNLITRCISRIIANGTAEGFKSDERLSIYRAFLVISFQASTSAKYLEESGEAYLARTFLWAKLNDVIKDNDFESSLLQMNFSNDVQGMLDHLKQSNWSASLVKCAACALSNLIPDGGGVEQAALSLLFAELALPDDQRKLFARQVAKDIKELPSLFDHSVWEGAQEPKAIQINHDAVLEKFAAHPAWSFWRRFYEGTWNGTFDEWDLAFEVIQIPEEDWAKGYEHIGEVIARLEARLKLEREIKLLREQLASKERSFVSPSAGHNQGPPLDTPFEEISKTIARTEPLLDALEAEIAKDEPDPEQINHFAGQLWNIAKVIATYCGSKIDKALDKAIETASETGTKWAIRIGAGSLVTTNERVQSVAKATWEFARTLAN